MRAGIKVTYTDDTSTTVVAAVPDFIAWERRTKRRTSDLVNGVAIEDLAYIAWHACKRTGDASVDFDAWINQLAEVEMTEMPAPKAGRKAASTGS